ncbi:MAG: methyltransferase domain-containing protein [Candidatus Magasanikbacteria bacterium]|nr:methyltransferase domain-containing protein [Candidatus Magasanikbacteria bacterium]
MKNKNFFYLQYDKINWQNQEKTEINYFVNDYIISEIISKKKSPSIKIFDIGFGIGFFLKMLYHSLITIFDELIIEGCEPSDKNYQFSLKKPLKVKEGVKIQTYNSTFLNTETKQKFDFITAIYVFPHFVQDEFDATAKKINEMLEQNGQFILVVANEAYLEEKLKSMQDLFIERNVIEYNGKKYKEVLHYSDIPKIGKIIDYNREEKFYLDLFKNNGLELVSKKDLNDNGFLCTVFVFEKK